ncbi:hypothetical protein CC99x_006345 [Candidatus Berkiella cookevillensis]|uniref:Uncharacterized protein n=1 Tax=Candidatus Berkiella cookevillensis TaxID=437022 RepID=A0A0Q9YH12_9GAMM|nr:hypothetical protein [Candidatus Berkiella cookevillensis]MCS5708526.1 hypothetical protein [Candidatus Berkiella cookevillensis]
MNTALKVLNQTEIEQVQGGNLFFYLLELPHIIMGLREFVNYAIGRGINGCENIDESDYITQGFCSLLGTNNE